MLVKGRTSEGQVYELQTPAQEREVASAENGGNDGDIGDGGVLGALPLVLSALVVGGEAGDSRSAGYTDGSGMLGSVSTSSVVGGTDIRVKDWSVTVKPLTAALFAAPVAGRCQQRQ